MSDSSVLARWFLGAGAGLGLLGGLLWWKLPLALSFPPYLVTAMLGIVYGCVCLGLSRRRPRTPQS